MKTYARLLAGIAAVFLFSAPATSVFAFYSVTQTRYTAEFGVSASLFDASSGAVIDSDSSSDSTQGSINGPLPSTNVLSLNVNPVMANGNWIYARLDLPLLRLSFVEENTYGDSLYNSNEIYSYSDFVLENYCQTQAECSNTDIATGVITNAVQLGVEQDFNLASPATIDFYLDRYFGTELAEDSISLMLKDMNGNPVFSLTGETSSLYSSQDLLAGNYTVAYSWTHNYEFSDGVGGLYSKMSGGVDSTQILLQMFMTPQPISSVPIPATAWLFVTGLASLAGVCWKRRRN